MIDIVATISKNNQITVPADVHQPPLAIESWLFRIFDTAGEFKDGPIEGLQERSQPGIDSSAAAVDPHRRSSDPQSGIRQQYQS